MGSRTCCCLREAVGRLEVLRALPHLDGRREAAGCTEGAWRRPDSGAGAHRFPLLPSMWLFTPLLF